MQMFRVKAIAEMVTCATAGFVEHVGNIMNGSIKSGFALIKESPCAQLCSAAKAFDKRHGYQHRDVLKIELQGDSLIKSSMSMLWKGICEGEAPAGPFARFAYGAISENYRRVFESSRKDDYAKCQLLCDAISGMTENYLVKKHGELKELLDASVKANPVESLDNLRERVDRLLRRRQKPHEPTRQLDLASLTDRGPRDQ